jgi:ABC-type antimicrobial peptide transport system permease subunit
MVFIRGAARTDTVSFSVMGTFPGALVSVALLRVLASESALFSSPPVWVWLMVAGLPTATVLVAGVLPALRASHADPLTIMRDEA